MVWTIHFKTASVSGKILDNSITAVTIMDFSWQNTFRLPQKMSCGFVHVVHDLIPPPPLPEEIMKVSF